MEYEIEIVGKKISLNKNVFDRQKVPSHEISNILKLYKEKDIIEMAIEISDIDNLKIYNELWWSVEHKIQEKMKFQLNDNFIKFWLVPRCLCNKVENDKSFPLGNYIISPKCPVHKG